MKKEICKTRDILFKALVRVSPIVILAILLLVWTQFFDKLKINHNQKRNFDYLNNVLGKYSSNKVFFGPELEMFYPAINAMHPRNWPLWMHPGLSWNEKYNTEMAKEFIVN